MPSAGENGLGPTESALLRGLPPERRSGDDRREISVRTFFEGGLRPRRRRSRRTDEATLFVDWHEPHLLFLAVMILLLSVADAFLTLTLLTQGAHEANPILAWLLDAHPGLFAIVKMSLTGMGVLVLVAVARAKVFRIIRVVTIMHVFVVAYAVLVYYEWSLLSRLV